MSNDELILSLILGALLWIWFSSIRTKELAVVRAKNMCLQAQVMLLDDSVALIKLGLARNPRGSMSLKRAYRFEFASDGALRYQGHITMLGSQIVGSEMDVYRMTED